MTLPSYIDNTYFEKRFAFSLLVKNTLNNKISPRISAPLRISASNIFLTTTTVRTFPNYAAVSTKKSMTSWYTFSFSTSSVMT